MNEEAQQFYKAAADAGSVAITLGTLAQWLPAIASLVSIVWMLFRIYETDTVQRWLGNKPRPGRGDD